MPLAPSSFGAKAARTCSPDVPAFSVELRTAGLDVLSRTTKPELDDVMPTDTVAASERPLCRRSDAMSRAFCYSGNGRPRRPNLVMNGPWCLLARSDYLAATFRADRARCAWLASRSQW